MSAPTYTPPSIEVPQDLQASVEAELRAEATPVATPEPAPEPTPTPTPEPTPVTPPAFVQPEPQVDKDELERGYLRDRDYRQKTMAVAEERRQLEAERQADLAARQQEAYLRQQYENALNDPDYLAQRSQALRQQLNLPTPDQAPTAQQVQSLLAQREQQLTAKFDKKLQDALVRDNIERMKFEYSNQIASFQQQILKDFPLLEVTPGVEKLITTQALDQHPKSLDEARSLIKQLASDRSTKLQKKIADSEQAAIMRHAKSQTTAIEPKGGTAPAVQATPKGAKMGSKQLEELVMADLAAELANKR